MKLQNMKGGDDVWFLKLLFFFLIPCGLVAMIVEVIIINA